MLGVVCENCLVCVRGVGVFVVEAANEFPQPGRVCTEIYCLECVFPSVALFLLDILVYFIVEGVDTVQDVWCGVLFA